MSDLHTKTLIEIRDALRDGTVTARQAVDDCLARIQATEPSIDALITVLADEARAQADAMDKEGPAADKPLWGVPLVIKDALTTKGVRTTCASKILDNFVPFYDAEAVARLKAAGAIILGKSNLDEFAMGSTTENSSAKATRNPWDLDRVPGGSSGGSAASVAASQCFGALGTDTGGSIRQPASLCGCVGLKPTYGRISRYGLVAYGSSLDQIGPMTRTVEDAAAMLQVMAGHDPKDSTCADQPVPDYLGALAARTDLSGMTIGLPAEYWGEGADPEVATALQATVDRARELGAKTVEVSLPNTRYAVAAYYIVAMAEASSNLARFDGVRYGVRDEHADELVDMYVKSRSAGFGDEVQRRIMIGTYVLSAGYYDAYYRKAAQVRALIKRDFDRCFEQCDLLAGPVSPVAAWPIGAMTNDPLKMYLMDIFTISLNLAGLPGISVPAGMGADSGMPVGLQLMGPAFGEADLLAAANVLYKACDAPRVPKGIK